MLHRRTTGSVSVCPRRRLRPVPLVQAPLVTMTPFVLLRLPSRATSTYTVPAPAPLRLVHTTKVPRRRPRPAMILTIPAIQQSGVAPCPRCLFRFPPSLLPMPPRSAAPARITCATPVVPQRFDRLRGVCILETTMKKGRHCTLGSSSSASFSFLCGG